MSYILYINNQLADLSEIEEIAITKQVNDIANISDRQVNFSKQFKLRKTKININIFSLLSLVGNQSNNQYQKNVCDLIDADSALHLIYKGQIVVTSSDRDYYYVNCFENTINFYKSIENLELSEIDISGLNHVKNVQNVVDSFTQNLPYKYIIADFNGKNDYFGVSLNIDYQIPSARDSYILNQIFEHLGYSYSGSIFQRNDFLKSFTTYINPNIIVTYIYGFTAGGAAYTNTQNESGLLITRNKMFPFYQVAPLTSTPVLEFSYNSIIALQDVKFLLGITGNQTLTEVATGLVFSESNIINYTIINYLNVIIQTGTLDSLNSAGTTFNLYAGDVINLTYNLTGTTDYALTTTFELIILEILRVNPLINSSFKNIKAKDFIKDFVVRYGLTMYSDNKKNLTFLTLDEIINNTAEDWSDKNVKFLNEKYLYNSYGKKNKFKYKYQDQNVDYNDSYFKIDNENLTDEKNIYTSIFYSPERNKTTLGREPFIYNQWKKEVKEDLNYVSGFSTNYKEDFVRFYKISYQDEIQLFPITIGSENLNQTATVTVVPYSKFQDQSFVELIKNNYSKFGFLLNKALILNVELNLSSFDFLNYDFKRLIYLEQKQEYYLVNKILNFSKKAYTKCELIKVDKDAVLDYGFGSDIFLNILSYSIENCVMILAVEAFNISQPVNVNVLFYVSGFGSFPNQLLTTKFSILNNNTIQIPLSDIDFGSTPLGIFAFVFIPTINANSNQFILSGLTNSCYVPTPVTNLTITSIEAIPDLFFGNNYKINFTTDAVLPTNVGFSIYEIVSGGISGQTPYQNVLTNDYFIIIGSPGIFVTYQDIKLKIGTLISNTFNF